MVEDPGRKELRETEESDGKDAIKVTDRRLFTADGELRDGASDDPGSSDEADPSSAADIKEEARDTAPEGSVETPDPRQEARGASTVGFEHHAIEEPEGVDFTMLINAMAQPALIFLGEIPHPGKGQAEVNLEQARLQIDLLDLLRIRCRGNMAPEEEGLLDQILYQLRMLYVSRSHAPGS